jgi:hypothetical protein
MTYQDIHNQINQKFSNFVDDEQAPEITNFFLKMADESKFDENVIAKNMKIDNKIYRLCWYTIFDKSGTKATFRNLWLSQY